MQGEAALAPADLLHDLPQDLRLDRTECGAFAAWQPRFAEHGIATFPVAIAGKKKAWAVAGIAKMGLKASTQLAASEQFHSCNAFGFVAGSKSGVTILDIDSPDENLVAHAMSWQGETPLVTRTLSGGHHLWYGHNGETKRWVKPWDDRPFDQLASGLVVAPPSRGDDGGYIFLSGSLDDIPALPSMRHPYAPQISQPAEIIGEGDRNERLFHFALTVARHCDAFDDLADEVRTRNAEFMPPLEDDEVMKLAASAWGYESRGENWKSERCAIMGQRQINKLIADPFAFSLLTWLKATNKPDARFMVANGLTDSLGWSRRQLPKARKKLIQMEYIVPLNRPSKDNPVYYRWGNARLQDRR